MLSDLKFAFRQLAKSPGFTAVAVISLALGIGANTAVFSAANAVLLRALPVPDPQDLRVLLWSGSDVRMSSFEGNSKSAGNHWASADCVHYPLFRALRAQASDVADVFGFAPVINVIARGHSEPFPTAGMMVTDNFFSGLGVQMALGRAISVHDDFSGAGGSVVITDSLWENRYARDPAVLGQPLVLNGTAFTIVGVLPRGFLGVRPDRPAEFYVPMSANSPFLYRPSLDSDFHWFVRLMARMKTSGARSGDPGVGDARLKAALDVAFAREVGAIMQRPEILVENGSGGAMYDRARYRKPLLLMLGIVGMVMLVACANLAGLSLARGVLAEHQLAVRAALGGSPWRLIRQSLAETLLLAGGGAAFGIFIAVLIRDAVVRLLIGSSNEVAFDVSLDARVLGYTVVVGFITTLLSGLLPAIRASRADPISSLKQQGARGAPRQNVGRALVAAQIAVSLILLAGAALFVRSLIALTKIETGFSTERLLLVQVNVRGSSHAKSDPAAYFDRLQTTLAAIPGARSAALLDFPLLGGLNSSGTFDSFSDEPAGKTMQTSRLRVGESFFATMGVPIVAGRGLLASDDAASPKVVVVNQAFVRQHLAGRSPIGLTINTWNADWRIVGVCGDAKYSDLKAPVPPTSYFPFRQMFYGRFRTTHLQAPYVAIRTDLTAEALAPSVRNAIAAIDPAVGITDITTQERVRARSLGQEQLFATLCGALAILAVLLSCIGLYSLIAFGVACRRREFGIRIALGANGQDIARPIVREALVIASIGIALGTIVVFASVRLIASHLYGINPYDPVILLSICALFLSVAAAAAWIPAVRATRVSPMESLRAE